MSVDGHRQERAVAQVWIIDKNSYIWIYGLNASSCLLFHHRNACNSVTCYLFARFAEKPDWAQDSFTVSESERKWRIEVLFPALSADCVGPARLPSAGVRSVQQTCWRRPSGACCVQNPGAVWAATLCGRSVPSAAFRTRTRCHYDSSCARKFIEMKCAVSLTTLWLTKQSNRLIGLNSLSTNNRTMISCACGGKSHCVLITFLADFFHALNWPCVVTKDPSCADSSQNWVRF